MELRNKEKIRMEGKKERKKERKKLPSSGG